jgi:hypothetical protein
MKSFGFRLSVCWLVLAVSLGLVACGSYGGASYSSINGYMTGPWDFTVTNAKGNVPFVIEAYLTQDHHGNISATGSVTANGPAGNVSDVFIFGSSLSFVDGIAVDYLGYTCTGTDSGDRSMTGTVNSSNQVTLNQNVGGTAVATITGTLDNFATPPTPPFTGTLTSSGTCGGGGSATVTGEYLNSVPLTGHYAGTSAADNTENIVMAITNTNGSLTGNGSDSKLGNFTLTGNAVGNAFSATLTYSSSPGNSGPVFGYYDMKLGARGSILLVSSLAANSASCPNGEPRYNNSCLIAILAMQ